MKKQISTEQNASNIQEVMQLLAEIPTKLEAINTALSDEQLRAPLRPGERTPTEMLAHLLHCEAITSQAIYLALLINEPLLPNIHPERDLGRLLRLDMVPFKALLTYFKIRRTILIGVLEPLPAKKWSRVTRQENKERRESVYWQARGQALHELEHILDLESKLGRIF